MKGVQKSMKLTFMPVPLTAGEKRRIYRRLSEREPVVFVEPSVSSRKMRDESSSNLRRKKRGLNQTEPVVFVDSVSSKEQPDVKVAFGFSSTQRRMKQREPAVSQDCPASSKNRASDHPTNNRRMKKGPEQRECKGKAPSEEPAALPCGAEKDQQVKPKELFSCVKSIINRLTPETFQDLMTQLKELTVETEERLETVINLVFERAMLRPKSSVLYANMCRCLTKVKVPTTADSTVSVSFQTLLIRRCQAEFQRNHLRDDVFEERQRRLEAAKNEEELERLKNELDDAKASRRSVNNIKFIGELFKSKILSEAVMHSCIQRLLNNRDEESLECLCELFGIIGKELEVATAKRVMDSYFGRMDGIIKEGKTSSRVSIVMKDTVDLRQRNWLPESSEIDQTCVKVNSTDSCSSALQPSDPLTSSGQTGCRVPQTKDATSSSAAQTELTLDEKSQHIPDKAEDSDRQLRSEKEGPTLSSVKPSLTEEEMEFFSEVVIEKYLNTDDLKEALHCVAEQNSPSVLHVFVRSAVDLTFECSSNTRRQTGLLLLELHKSGVLPAEQVFKGLQEILEVAEYIDADIPEIWLCLAELISPVLHKGGASMAELFGNIRTLVPLEPASVLLAL